MSHDDPTLYTIPEDDQAFLAFAKDPRWTHLIGLFMPVRPGVTEFMMVLEHTHYKPGTRWNDLFQLRIWQWSGFGWVIATIPTSDRHIAESVADQTGLRMAAGVPTMLSSSGIETFPLRGDNVFTLENKAGHPVYQNDPATRRAMLDGELETLEHLTGGSKKPTS